jgi:predicted small secreted protein
MEKYMKNAIFGIGLLICILLLSTGCSTIDGIGKDIQSASKIISDKLNEPDVELNESTVEPIEEE